MTKALSIFAKTSYEYQRLQTACDILNKKLKNINVSIETTYFDIGQNWQYTTIIATNPNEPTESIMHKWQLLTPRQQETILYSESQQMYECLNNIISEINKKYVA